MSLLIRGDSAQVVCVDGVVGDGPAGAVLEIGALRIARGRVCAHTHLYSGLAPLGMPAPRHAPANFVEILEQVWWRLDRALTAETLRASARLYVAEALLAGTTALVDHHESPNFIAGSLDILAAACADLGMRAALCYGITERNDGLAEARAGLAECRRFIEQNTAPTLVGMVGLHASFTVSDTAVTEAAALCRELGAVMHVHVAEDRADVEDAQVRGYAGPLERLLHFGALPAGSIVAHGVHFTPEQVRRVDELGLWLVQNPRSNAGNRVGYGAQLKHGRRVALGTDGYPAVMGDERAALVELGAEFGDTLAVAQARLDAGRDLMAELFGQPVEGLGSAADFIVEEPANETVEETGEAPPRHVVVAGHLVVEDGALVRGDIEVIRAEARTAADRLWAAMAHI